MHSPLPGFAYRVYTQPPQKRPSGACTGAQAASVALLRIMPTTCSQDCSNSSCCIPPCSNKPLKCNWPFENAQIGSALWVCSKPGQKQQRSSTLNTPQARATDRNTRCATLLPGKTDAVSYSCLWYCQAERRAACCSSCHAEAPSVLCSNLGHISTTQQHQRQQRQQLLKMLLTHRSLSCLLWHQPP